MKMGSLNAIVFSCGTVTIYFTGVDEQRRLAVPTEKQTVPFPSANFPFLHMSLGNGTIGINCMENHSDQTQICFQISGVKSAHSNGQREQSQYAELVRTQPVTANIS